MSLFNKIGINKLLHRFGDKAYGSGSSCLLGLGISITGSLGVGVLHVVAIQLSALNGWQAALSFSLGCALVEFVFVCYAAKLTWFLSKNSSVQVLFDWSSLFLLILLGVLCFVGKQETVDSPQNLANLLVLPPLIMGMFLRFINPTMVAFWLGWQSILLGRHIRYRIVLFAFGAALGTVIMHSLYIFSGQWAMDFFRKNAEYLTWTLGSLFFLTAIVHGTGLIRKQKRDKSN